MSASIHPFSLVSVRLAPIYKEPVGSATGFVVGKGNEFYLLTNWHVVSGLKNLAAHYSEWSEGHPRALRVEFHVMHDKIGENVSLWSTEIPLHDREGRLLWVEIGNKTGRADVVALPLQIPRGIRLIALGFSMLGEDSKLALYPGEPVSIVGFPRGRSIDRIVAGVWKTGHLASDLGLNYMSEWPSLLVDVTGRPGMSGSPVYAVRYLASLASSGKFETAGHRDSGVKRLVSWFTGRAPASPGFWTEFLGIYSGGIEEENEDRRRLELGIVWKRALVRTLIDLAQQGVGKGS